jgi:hypothetical protein
MFNLAFCFDDANRALANHADRLTIYPLPATVFMMQMDVINHYRHALNHYFTLTLSEEYLQNSSLGTPYQKWAYFTNEDFGELSFAIHNLLRYTSRLVHESELLALLDQRRWEERARISNTFTELICDLKYRNKAIGLVVQEGNHVSISSIAPKIKAPKFGQKAEAGGSPSYFRVEIDASGKERDVAIDMAEFAQLKRFVEAVKVETFDLGDRRVLQELRERGQAEICELETRNRAFGELCGGFYRSRNVAQPFPNLNEGYWI